MTYTKNMTTNIANRILVDLGFTGYNITAIYEDSFKATRNNEWFLGEVNVELFAPWTDINERNVYEKTTTVTHVLKRYK